MIRCYTTSSYLPPLYREYRSLFQNDYNTIIIIQHLITSNIQLIIYKPIDKRVLKPGTVHKLLTHKYFKDSYINKLVQHLLTHNFIIGWRVPSEPTIIRVSDNDFDNGSIIIPEEYIMAGKRYKIFKNQVDYCRPKVENQYSGDYLYLQPSGKPFTKDSLKMRLFKKHKTSME